jgi:hypothetical protein
MIERLERVISAIGFRISDVEDSGSWLLFSCTLICWSSHDVCLYFFCTDYPYVLDLAICL